MSDDEAYRRRFYRAVAESVFLEPDGSRAVPLHQQRYGGDATSVDHDPSATWTQPFERHATRGVGESCARQHPVAGH
ncbi:MAG: hypothetical protein ACR2MO_12500 [Acidimicrobiales bacterium]